MKKFVVFLVLQFLVFSALFLPAAASANDSWWNVAWSQRKKLTFLNASQGEVLSNFPVLVRLTSSNFDFSKANATGNDIRFIDADGQTQLSYEIEKWDPSGDEAIIWVKVPEISATDSDYMHLYYGNTSASSAQGGSAVWSNSFNGVWHLKEDPTVSVADSSPAGVALANRGALTIANLVTGKINGGLNLINNCFYLAPFCPGADSFLEASDGDSDNYRFTPSQDFSVSIWINPITSTNKYYAIPVGNAFNANSTRQFRLLVDQPGNNGKVHFQVLADGTSGGASGTVTSTTKVNDGNWHHVTGTRTGTTLRIYVDGVLEGTISVSSNPTLVGANRFRVGSDGNRYFQYDGKLDEVRMSSTSRSSAWVLADYKSGNDTFLAYGPTATSVVDTILTLNPSTQPQSGGLLRMTGRATVSDFFTIIGAQFRTNGGAWHDATATDGTFNSDDEALFFDFDPKENNNTKPGYVINARATNSNRDVTGLVTVFSPFYLHMPLHNSFLTNSFPSFSFEVNGQRQLLDESLQKYTIQLRPHGADWQTYIDSIPVNYESAKDRIENTAPKVLDGTGNGSYIDKKIHVQYSQDGSRIEVYAKPADVNGVYTQAIFGEGGKRLSPGEYEWRATSVDRTGFSQETNIWKFTLGSQVSLPRSMRSLPFSSFIASQPDDMAPSSPSATPIPSPQAVEMIGVTKIYLYQKAFLLLGLAVLAILYAIKRHKRR